MNTAHTHTHSYICLCVYASTLRLQSYLTRDWEMGTGENGNLGLVMGTGTRARKQEPEPEGRNLAAGHASVPLSVATHSTPAAEAAAPTPLWASNQTVGHRKYPPPVARTVNASQFSAFASIEIFYLFILFLFCL